MKKGIEGASKNADLKNTLIILNICRFLLKMIISEKKILKKPSIKSVIETDLIVSQCSMKKI